MSYIDELKNSSEDTLNNVITYIENTIKAKALFNKGGWKLVGEVFSENERFNHNFSISATAICCKLRDNKQPINLPIQSNMSVIEKRVNSKVGVPVIEYYVDRKNHAFKIIL